ncbi:MAG: SDR family NAD(P)-dependent oxidoreductase [Bacilli bacterium]
MKPYALITGASMGLGYGFAFEYAKQGYNLVLVARSLDLLKELKEELQAIYSIDIKVLKADLSQSDTPLQIYEYTKKHNLFIKVLINNAGFSNGNEYHKLTSFQITNQLMVNVQALSHLTRFYLEDMVLNNEGIIINIASVIAFLPSPSATIYGASKAYVLAFTKSLALEYAHTNLKFQVLCPGTTKTNFFQHEQSKMLSKPRRVQQVINSSNNGLLSSKIIVIDGFKNKVVCFLPRLLSFKVLGFITLRYQKYAKDKDYS